eukprot:GEMP01027559.1.p1 GENE.GEMP01027559.1~~GEMP01027559.1.p1  ORF type:complete len:437 (+),score=68.54 GEMP01027559.1:38-1348(+)
MVFPLAQFAVIVPAVCVICSLAVAAGVGGGALYMPFYVWVSGDAHVAVPLAKITTNGVAWSAFCFNLFGRHPEKKQPLIDYDAALLLEPLTLLGTIIGVLCNLLMTNWQVLCALISVTSVTAIKTFQNGWQKKKEEDYELSLLSRVGTPRNDIELRALADGLANTPSHDFRSTSEDESPHAREDDTCRAPLVKMSHGEKAAAVSSVLAFEARQYPYEKILLLLFCMAYHAGSLFIIGGPREGICGGYWKNGVLAGNVAMQFFATMLWRQRCLRRQQHKDELGLPSTFRYDPITTLVFPFLSMFAGVCAGALGIAGGLIKGPIMIQWGLIPQSSTATAIFMIMFTSSSTILQFILLGRLELWSAVMFWATGFVGGYIGSHAVKLALQRSGRQSYLSIFLAYIIVFSGICMAGVVIAEMTGLVKSSETNISFSSFCAG